MPSIEEPRHSGVGRRDEGALAARTLIGARRNPPPPADPAGRPARVSWNRRLGSLPKGRYRAGPPPSIFAGVVRRRCHAGPQVHTTSDRVAYL